MDGTRKTPMRRLSRRVLEDNARLKLVQDDVVMPSGRQAIHWKVDYKLRGVGVVPILPSGQVLLGLHYRYCPEVWGWEIAAGGIEEGETIEGTARRELEEETGFRAGTLDFLLRYHPAPGLGNETFNAFAATGLEPTGEGVDADEIHELRAFAWPEFLAGIEGGEITDGFTITACLMAREKGLWGGA